MTKTKWKLTRDAGGEPQVEEWGEESSKCGMSLMGSQEARVRLAVSRVQFFILSRSRSFPDPVAHLHAGRVWLTDDIEAWAAAVGQ